MSGVVPEGDVDFVDVSNAELGYTNGCTAAQTIEAAAKFNLESCFYEDGPLVRKHYTNQPMNDWRLFALKESITDPDGFREVWCLAREADGSWLNSYNGNPGDFYGGEVRWVFRRKRSS